MIKILAERLYVVSKYSFVDNSYVARLYEWKDSIFLNLFFLYTNGIHTVSLFVHEVKAYHLFSHTFT